MVYKIRLLNIQIGLIVVSQSLGMLFNQVDRPDDERIETMKENRRKSFASGVALTCGAILLGALMPK